MVWAVLEDMLAANRTRAIGISDFASADIEALMATAKTTPAVNQCSMGAGHTDTDTLAYVKA